MKRIVLCAVVVLVLGSCVTGGELSVEIEKTKKEVAVSQEPSDTQNVNQKPRRASSRLDILELLSGIDRAKKQRRPASSSANSRIKRSGYNQGHDVGTQMVDSRLAWGKCDVACGIGYQSRRKLCYDQPDLVCSEGDSLEIQRCLGIDCEHPEALESKIACSGGGLMIIGIVVGMVSLLVIIGVAFCVKTVILPKTKGKIKKRQSSSSSKRKGSKRPPAPLPRKETTQGKAVDSDDDHLYEDIDELQTKKAKANTYVTRTSNKTKSKKEKKRLFGSKRKGKKESKMTDSDEDSDHAYVDPDELNQPGSEEVEIERLRKPPPPPGTKDRKTSKSKKQTRESSRNEYEVPMQDDYMEIE